MTVASRSQKQVALLEQPKAKVETFYRWPTGFDNESDEPEAAQRILRMDNRKESGLGLPLPAGSFTLFTTRGGQPFLLGEGRMTDRSEGETVEVTLDEAPGVRVTQREIERDGEDDETELLATNDLPHPVRFEVRFDEDRKPRHSSGKLIRRDGAWWWTTNIPANGSRTLRVRYRALD